MWNYFEEGLRWAIFAILVLIFIRLLIYFFQEKNKAVSIMGILIVGIIIGYTFFTDDGSVRLNIALQGHPLNAYDPSNKMIEVQNTRTLKARYYEPSKPLLSMSGERVYHECKYYGPIKISIPTPTVNIRGE